MANSLNLLDGAAGPPGLRTELETRGVSVRFAGVTALLDVDLRVSQGEIVGLIGPNGAGKTTLINVLSGFQRPSAGQVVLDGRDVTRWTAHRLARAGVVRTFQSVRVFPQLTVRDNVIAASFAVGDSQRQARATVTQALDRVGLAAVAHAEAGSLSYGQERRLGIARALATRPRILLLDEPAAGLNEQESDELLGTLRALRQESDLGMLVIEHDMRLIMRLCDRLQVLDYGKTIAQGAPGDVSRNPRVLEAYLGHDRGSKGDAHADD